MTRSARVDAAASILGCILVTVALALIWGARIWVAGVWVGQDVYVSELGATGAPTALVFEVALLLIVAGGSLVGFAGRDVRSRVRWLALWTPAVSLWIASGFFLVASQVTCTAGCPLPIGAAFTWQDTTHITCAVLAFVAACWGIVQTAFAAHHRVLAGFSFVMAVLVGMISGIGGLLSLFQVKAVAGGNAEFIATTLAIAWVVVYGVAIAARRLRVQRPDIRSSSRLASPTST
jgi:hypothetical protein